MSTTWGPTRPTIADGSIGDRGRSPGRSSPTVDGDADAGTVASPSPTTASTLANHDHLTERWCHLLIPSPPASPEKTRTRPACWSGRRDFVAITVMQVAIRDSGQASLLYTLRKLCSRPSGRRNRLRQVPADVADHVDEREVAVGKPPPPVDAFEPVVVAAGDDGLQGEPVDLLQHRVVTAATRGAGVLVDLDDRIGRHVLGSRCPVGMQHDQRLPDGQQSGRVNGVLSADLDAGVLEEGSRSRQVAGVD